MVWRANECIVENKILERKLNFDLKARDVDGSTTIYVNVFEKHFIIGEDSIISVKAKFRVENERKLLRKSDHRSTEGFFFHGNQEGLLIEQAQRVFS